ncbi:7130_t:CDS:2, partial [Acaulospora colombiana]
MVTDPFSLTCSRHPVWSEPSEELSQFHYGYDRQFHTPLGPLGPDQETKGELSIWSRARASSFANSFHMSILWIFCRIRGIEHRPNMFHSVIMPLGFGVGGYEYGAPFIKSFLASPSRVAMVLDSGGVQLDPNHVNLRNPRCRAIRSQHTMNWPDDQRNARKPRYSAETGSRLLEKKNNDLGNLQNEILKLKERVDTITQERDDVTNKELVREKMSRVNLEKELQSASDSCKRKDLEHRQLQHQLEDMSSKHNDVDQRNKMSSLERRVQALQLENARLSGLVERPISRNSSIPVPKGRQPRASSEVRSSHLEDEIKSYRVELAEEKSKVKRAEAKMRKAEADATQYLNEKIAGERKAQQRIDELESELQEARDQLSSLPILSQPDRENSVDIAQYEKVLKDYRSAEEQLQAAKVDNIDLTNRLNRKSAQCETLQEKLDEYMYSAPDVESLSQELAIAKKEASDALKELALLKESKGSNSSRRETLLAVRYELEDRGRELRALQEKLRRRESSSAELEAQLEQVGRLFSEREDLKDELSKANSRIRFLEPQSQFNQKEIALLRSQVAELEIELRKQRSLNSQQQELYHEIVKSCSEAERRAEELDRELSNLQEEFANRSSADEAIERRQQWEEALERVQELERELAGHKDKSRRAPRRSRPSLLPVPNFGDPSELDMVAKVVLALDRIREERNALRGSVEFLTFELQAKDAAIERRLENQKSRFLHLLQSAEEDISSLRQDLSAYEDVISRSHQSRDEQEGRIRKAQNVSTAALIALQHIHGISDSEHGQYTQEYAKLESELRALKSASEETINHLTALAQGKEDALSGLNVRYQEAIRDLQE